jgi:glucosamine--fructose-6-phosphate aminotransferase (isomerizing)
VIGLAGGWNELGGQPDVVLGQLESAADVQMLAGAITECGTRQVRFVAHGSGDNAATYGIYALGLLARMPAVRDSLSLPVYYHTTERLDDVTVIALSRSREPDDVSEYIETARAAGAMTVAITDDPASPVAHAAEFVLPLRATPGQEPAGPSTFIGSVTALALLAAALGQQLDAATRALRQLAASMPAAIASARSAAAPIGALLTEHQRAFVTGRGLQLATAREIALALTQTARILACPISTTELLHGPIAALEHPFPVWAIGGQDSTDAMVKDALDRAHRAGAPTILSAPIASCLHADHDLTSPPAPTPLLAPPLAVLSGHAVALHIAEHRQPATDRLAAGGPGSRGARSGAPR